MSLLPPKNYAKVLRHYKICLFSLGGGNLKTLTEARSKIIKTI
jgi:hypothetical protein